MEDCPSILSCSISNQEQRLKIESQGLVAVTGRIIIVGWVGDIGLGSVVVAVSTNSINFLARVCLLLPVCFSLLFLMGFFMRLQI